MKAMRARAALWLALALGVAAACGMQFFGSASVPLQTNLLALLPATERNPLAEQAVAQLAQAAGNRALFLVGDTTAQGASAAARALAQRLRASSAFASVLCELPPLDPKLLSAVYRAHRFHLLSDADRTALAGDAELATRLQRKLYATMPFGLSLSLADDPFGLGDDWLASLPLKNWKLEPQDDLLVTQGDGRHWVFVAAQLKGSAYDSAQQDGVSAAVAQAEQALHRDAPTAQLLRTGTVFYANDARASAQGEFDLIGAGSLVGMLALLYLVFRSLRPLALGLLCVLFGVGAAAAVTVAVQGQLHLITLVFGASLIGEAVDYAVQYFAAHLGAGADWEPMAGLKRIAPGLTLALATSLLGYGALLLAPFPALAQIALFAFVGLFAAWLSVFLLLPALLARPGARDPRAAVAYAQRLLGWWQAHMNRRVCVVLAALLLLFAAPGWWRLQGNDDVRLLIARAPALVAQEERIRTLSAMGNSSQFFLVEGATPDAVLAREQALTARLKALAAQGEISGYQALSSFVPPQAVQQANHALWRARVFADPAGIESLLERHGLRPQVAQNYLADFQAAAPLQLADWLASPMAQPYRHLWLDSGGQGYAALVLPQGTRDLRLLAQAASDLPGVTLVDKAASVSALFRDYRRWGALWLLGALCLVYGALCLRYRWRQAAVTLAPTLLAMALALGVFGYIGTPLTLFNLMALMLVLGVGVNYAIFLREGGVRAAATLAGVLLSAGTTLLSFGLLAFSSMPALSGFGLTLLLGVGLCVLLAPMVLTFSAPSAP